MNGHFGSTSANRLVIGDHTAITLVPTQFLTGDKCSAFSRRRHSSPNTRSLRPAVLSDARAFPTSRSRLLDASQDVAGRRSCEVQPEQGLFVIRQASVRAPTIADTDNTLEDVRF